MSLLTDLLAATSLRDALPDAEAAGLAGELGDALGMCVYPRSLTAVDGMIVSLAREGAEKRLLVTSAKGGDVAVGVEVAERRTGRLGDIKIQTLLCPTSHTNALAMRKRLPFTAPSLQGVKLAAGCGDRLGLATPGHIRAIRGTGVTPFLAQQSIREMTRTQRSPEQVMDDATWGVLQEGWRLGFGSDADHLKQITDIDRTLAAGFTMFTVDPGDHVDNAADTDDLDALRRKFSGLAWDELECAPVQCIARYVGKTFPLSDAVSLAFNEEQLLRAAVKYAPAVAHTVRMYRHLMEKAGEGKAELEMSVDETDTPTKIEEHFFVANELKRLGVKWVSLAPRFVGRFEKGVDYIGDLAELESTFATHAAIARHVGPYKLSPHSGSDKFSVYPVAARQAGPYVHLKTAGTSYLEALRAIADVNPPLFREILTFAHERYAEDKATYHVSADPAKVPTEDRLKDHDLAGVLDLFDGRQLLHVTFGSVLTSQRDDGSSRYRDRLLQTLREDEDAHYDAIETHFEKHIQPFAN